MDPLVSVLMITYNHENYIEKAIESVMMQNTDFAFKLFVGVDFSTDRTQYVCSLLKEKYFNRIELFLNKQNIGMRLNALQMFDVCYNSNSKYIAIIEGDDYWTDEFKLQKQIDIMESDKSIIMSVHNAIEINQSIERRIITSCKGGYINANDLIEKKIRIPTLSIIYRSTLLLDEKLFLKLKSGDRYLEVAAASAGKIFYIDEVMGVKRTLNTGKLGQWKKDPLKAILEKYKSNVLLLDIVPPHLKKYMHRYLFRICIQILKLKRLSELKFLGLALRHRVLGI